MATTTPPAARALISRLLWKPECDTELEKALEMRSVASVKDPADVLGMNESQKKLVAAIRRLAIEGTGEKTAAHGIGIGVVPFEYLEFLLKKDEEGFPLFGRLSTATYDFRGRNIALDSAEGWKNVQICAREDGMIVVTPDNMLVCGNFFIQDTRKGTNEGGHGGRHLAISAFSNTLKTLAIKVSEDSCGHNEKEIANATMKVFWRSHLAETWPVHAKEADAPPAAGSAAAGAGSARKPIDRVAACEEHAGLSNESKSLLQRVQALEEEELGASGAGALHARIMAVEVGLGLAEAEAPVVAVAVPDAAGADARAALREADARLAEADAERVALAKRVAEFEAEAAARARPTPRPRPTRGRGRAGRRGRRGRRARAGAWRIDMLTLEGHAGDVNGVAFMGDGRLASVSDDETARVWDPARATLRTLGSHE